MTQFFISFSNDFLSFSGFFFISFNFFSPRHRRLRSQVHSTIVSLIFIMFRMKKIKSNFWFRCYKQLCSRCTEFGILVRFNFSLSKIKEKQQQISLKIELIFSLNENDFIIACSGWLSTIAKIKLTRNLSDRARNNQFCKCHEIRPMAFLCNQNRSMAISSIDERHIANQIGHQLAHLKSTQTRIKSATKKWRRFASVRLSERTFDLWNRSEEIKRNEMKRLVH